MSLSRNTFLFLVVLGAAAAWYSNISQEHPPLADNSFITADDSSFENILVLEFIPGEKVPDPFYMIQLNLFADRIYADDETVRIDISAWPDSIPEKDQSEDSRQLAEERIDFVKSVLENKIAGKKTIRTWNMARSDHRRLVLTTVPDKPEPNSVFAKKNMDSATYQSFRAMDWYGAPSKAVIVINFEK